jgi:hypothetical protein
VLLSNINYIIKDISYFKIYYVEYKFINNKLVFNLNLLVFKYKRDAIYKRIKIFKLNYNRLIKCIKSALLRG